MQGGIVSELNVPNIGVELLRIHSIVTRSLRVAIEHSELFARQGYPGPAVREGFISYLRSFVSVLDAHHDTEDQLAFPYLRDKFPDVPFDLLMSQHQVMVTVLNQLKTVVEEMDAHPEHAELLISVSLLLKRIDELWHPHIRIEEEHFTVDRMDATLPPDEQARLINLFMEHSQEHAKPDFLVIPFLLYNLPPEQRSIFAKAMPQLVVQELVPVVWKEKWEPMKPFLIV
jgi:hemerythrin-like domain-containing protein